MNLWQFEIFNQNSKVVRFKGAKSPTPPKPVDPTPIPSKLDEEVLIKDQDRRRQRIAQAGRGGTILTQGQSLASGNATLLGRTVS